MGATWGDREVPESGQDDWEEYVQDYFNAFFTVNCCMSIAVFAAMGFAMASGVGDYEKGKIGYSQYI